jgi:hypothetical protein
MHNGAVNENEAWDGANQEAEYDERREHVELKVEFARSAYT